MHRARWLAIAGVIAVAAARPAPPCAAQPVPLPDVEALEAQAEADVAAGRLEAALRGFERVYALRPDPVGLFVIGNLQRQLGRCDRAVATLEDYLATRPGEAAAKLAQGWIEMCQATAPPAPPPAPPPAVIEPLPPPRHGAPDRGRRRAALVLGGLAVVAAGGAIATELLARGRLADAQRAADTGDAAGLDDHYGAANRLHYTAQSAGLVAVGCGVTAAVVWWTARGRTAPAIAVAPRSGGAVASWSRGF